MKVYVTLRGKPVENARVYVEQFQQEVINILTDKQGFSSYFLVRAHERFLLRVRKGSEPPYLKPYQGSHTLVKKNLRHLHIRMQEDIIF